MLAVVGTRQILTRMLTNLKAIYFNDEEYGKALSIVERLLLSTPTTPANFETAGCSRAASAPRRRHRRSGALPPARAGGER